MPELQIKVISDKCLEPSYAHDTDVGLDLICPTRNVIQAEGISVIPLEIKMAVPIGHVGWIVDRSSLAVGGLHVVAGIVDPGYRGEVKVAIRNLNKYPYVLEQGVRVAQLLIIPVVRAKIITQLGELPDTSRGEGGFGSTGA